MKPYNLLREPWLPLRLSSGKLTWSTPEELVDSVDPPLAIETGRPDLDGALIQWLIGLLQTSCAPATEEAWRKWFTQPPSAETLRRRWAPLEAAFNLIGDGPLFMQDVKMDAATTAKEEVAALLIDSPGGNALKENADLFVKRGHVETLSLASAAAALYTLQTFAPAGGAGHRTSLRGGGPLTTLIRTEGLWRTCWLNVLTARDLGFETPVGVDDLPKVFPWMGRLRTSEDGRVTTPEHVHPTHVFWGMPRRIRLQADSEPGVCDISGQQANVVVRRYETRPHGTNYKGAFEHPLTPYSKLKDNEPWNPKKGGPIPYRDWPHLAVGTEDRRPARTIRTYASSRRGRIAPGRLWAFGYEMDNMKPICWHAAVAPLLTVDDRQTGAFRQFAQAAVAASEEVRRTLKAQLKNALFRRPQDARGDLSPHDQCFWTLTEPSFFQTLSEVRDALEQDAPIPTRSAETWLAALHAGAIETFRRGSQELAGAARLDLKRVARARDALEHFTSPRAKKLRALMNLTLLQHASKESPNA